MNMNEKTPLTPEEKLARKRASCRKYYYRNQEELSEKRRIARQKKLEAMTPEELAQLRERNRNYQRKYRAENPARVAVWTMHTAIRKLERMKEELEADEG